MASPPFNKGICKTHAIRKRPISTYPETANINYHRIRLINCWADPDPVKWKKTARSFKTK